MAFVLISQRVDISQPHAERRDALDQRWYNFLMHVGLTPLPMPNHKQAALLLLKNVDIAGVILSGGNDLARFDGNVPERDETEKAVLEEAIKRSLPVLGVCRGMQFLADYYGSELSGVASHAGTRHPVIFADGTSREVNSYHNYGVVSLSAPLKERAHAPDGLIEAMQHATLRIAGICWHPERESVFDQEDVAYFKSWFGVKS